MTTQEKQLPAEPLALQSSPVRSALALTSYDEALRIARLAKAGGLCPDQESEAKCGIKILAGAEMGLGPIEALTGLYIHKSGSVGQMAHLIRAKIAAHPRYRFDTLAFTDEHCSIQCYVDGKIPNDEDKGKITWTWERAKTAGLASGPNATTWNRNKRNMLFKQCIQDAARVHFHGLFGGFNVIDKDTLESIPDVDVYEPSASDITESGASEDAQGEEAEAVEADVVAESEPQEDLSRAISADERTRLFAIGKTTGWIPRTIGNLAVKAVGANPKTPLSLNVGQYQELLDLVHKNTPEELL